MAYDGQLVDAANVAAIIADNGEFVKNVTNIDGKKIVVGFDGTNYVTTNYALQTHDLMFIARLVGRKFGILVNKLGDALTEEQWETIQQELRNSGQTVNEEIVVLSVDNDILCSPATIEIFKDNWIAANVFRNDYTSKDNTNIKTLDEELSKLYNYEYYYLNHEVPVVNVALNSTVSHHWRTGIRYDPEEGVVENYSTINITITEATSPVYIVELRQNFENAVKQDSSVVSFCVFLFSLKPFEYETICTDDSGNIEYRSNKTIRAEAPSRLDQIISMNTILSHIQFYNSSISFSSNGLTLVPRIVRKGEYFYYDPDDGTTKKYLYVANDSGVEYAYTIYTIYSSNTTGGMSSGLRSEQIVLLATLIFEGKVSNNTDFYQIENATYPEETKGFEETYSDWVPVELPESVDDDLPYYPVTSKENTDYYSYGGMPGGTPSGNLIAYRSISNQVKLIAEAAMATARKTKLLAENAISNNLQEIQSIINDVNDANENATEAVELARSILSQTGIIWHGSVSEFSDITRQEGVTYFVYPDE